MSDWLEAEEAAALLGRTARQVLRYGTSGRVETRRQGRRLQYARVSVEQLASELEDGERTRPATVAPEMGRALVETLGLARELIEAQREIMRLRARVQQIEQQRAAAIRIIGELHRRK